MTLNPTRLPTVEADRDPRALPLADGAPTTEQRVGPAFRFIDAFAGIGGMRGGLEMVDGQCVFTIENDTHACRTYAANWGPLHPIDIRTLDPETLPEYDLLAAGFPCQPFSLAGVVKKESLRKESLRRANVIDEDVVRESVRRAHGFHDPVSGNLFFEIIRLIGGPWDLPQARVDEEALSPDSFDRRMEDEGNEFAQDADRVRRMPPVLLLENVRNLASHDQGRTLKVIRRRLTRSGYHVQHRVISAVHWVPQNRQRIFIVALRRDKFGEPFEFPDPPPGRKGLTEEMLTHDPETLNAHRISPGTFAALEKHRERHRLSNNGFGYGVARINEPTRTLSARYYKDGAEILVPLPPEMLGSDKAPYRRLTLEECAALMGFVEPFLKRPFVTESSRIQAYKQFGNAVVVPQVGWLGEAILRAAKDVFAARAAALKHVEASPDQAEPFWVFDADGRPNVNA